MNNAKSAITCFLRQNPATACKQLGMLSITLVALVAELGCAAGYNAHTDDSPDSKFAARCYLRGGFGRNYYAETKKVLVVSIFALDPASKAFAEKEKREAAAAGRWESHPGIGPTNTLVFEKKYSLKGSAVEWNSVWGPKNELTLIFLDDGPGVSTMEKDHPKRILRTLNYHFDPDLRMYKEDPAN